MSAPFQPGDVVVCVDASPARHKYWVKRGWRFPFAEGQILRVRAIAPAENGALGLLFEGHCEGNYERTGQEICFDPCRFRKIDDEVTDEFREQLRKLPVRERVS